MLLLQGPWAGKKIVGTRFNTRARLLLLISAKMQKKLKNCPTVQLEKRLKSVNAHAGFHKGHKVEEYRALEAAKFSSRLCLYKPVTAPLNTTKVIFLFSVGVSWRRTMLDWQLPMFPTIRGEKTFGKSWSSCHKVNIKDVNYNEWGTSTAI